MVSQSLLALATAFAAAEAAVKGFNYGSTNTAGTPLQESDYAALFTRAQNLQGTSGFTNARLYTGIQADSTNTPISAYSAAMSTKTSLLLGMWASSGDGTITNEIAALQSAISQYGTAFTDLVTAISVGSEDLYRDSVTGVENKDGIGAGPSVITGYISQVRAALANGPLASIPIGHVDTWDAWTNGSNSAVITSSDFLGVDSYPYFETTVPNAIGSQANTAFFNSYNAVKGVAGGKPVWITETGWPVSGPNSGSAVASVANAETYWQDVGCQVLGDIDTWWYTLEDAMPTTPSPSFGIIGSDLSSAPLYNLTCGTSSSSSTSSSSTGTSAPTSTGSTGTGKTTSVGSSGQTTSTTGTGQTTSIGSSGSTSTGMVVPPYNGTISTGSAASTSTSLVTSTGAAVTTTATGMVTSGSTGSSPSTSPTHVGTNDAGKAGVQAVAAIGAVAAMVFAL